MKTTKVWSKLLMVGMLGLVLTLGLVVVGCDEGSKCSENGNCYYDIPTGANKWCGDTGCAVYLTNQVSGSTIKCSCD